MLYPLPSAPIPCQTSAYTLTRYPSNHHRVRATVTPTLGCIILSPARPLPLAGRGLPEGCPSNRTGSRTPPPYAPGGIHWLPRSNRNARFPDVATVQFCKHHNAITVYRRLPYALHRHNGTVPPAGQLEQGTHKGIASLKPQARIASCQSHQNTMIPYHDGPPCNFFVHPGRGIHDRALGPWPKKLGRWAAAAESIQ